MNTWFNTPDRVAALVAAANNWRGTPWSANAEACGSDGGVSCHNLVRSLYIEAGFLSLEYPHIAGSPAQTRHSTESVITPWIDARPEFHRVSADESLLAGDLLGLRIYHAVGHLGIVLPNEQFVHVLMHKRTTIDELSDATWFTRIDAIWRPRA